MAILQMQLSFSNGYLIYKGSLERVGLSLGDGLDCPLHITPTDSYFHSMPLQPKDHDTFYHN